MRVVVPPGSGGGQAIYKKYDTVPNFSDDVNVLYPNESTPDETRRIMHMSSL